MVAFICLAKAYPVYPPCKTHCRVTIPGSKIHCLVTIDFFLPNLAGSSPATNAQREEFGGRQRPPTRWRRRENSTNGGPCASSRLQVLDSGLVDRRRLVIGRFALRHALRHMAILHRLAASIRSAATRHVNVIRQLAACNVTGPRDLVATLLPTPSSHVVARHDAGHDAQYRSGSHRPNRRLRQRFRVGRPFRRMLRASAF